MCCDVQLVLQWSIYSRRIADVSLVTSSCHVYRGGVCASDFLNKRVYIPSATYQKDQEDRLIGKFLTHLAHYFIDSVILRSRNITNRYSVSRALEFSGTVLSVTELLCALCVWQIFMNRSFLRPMTGISSAPAQVEGCITTLQYFVVHTMR